MLSEAPTALHTCNSESARLDTFPPRNDAMRLFCYYSRFQLYIDLIHSSIIERYHETKQDGAFLGALMDIQDQDKVGFVSQPCLQYTLVPLWWTLSIPLHYCTQAKLEAAGQLQSEEVSYSVVENIAIKVGFFLPPFTNIAVGRRTSR